MRLLLVVLASLVAACLASPPTPEQCTNPAIDRIVNFQALSGQLGTSQDFLDTSGQYKVTAYGYQVQASGDVATDLYALEPGSSVGDRGLGVFGSDAQNGVTSTFFIQIDLNDQPNGVYNNLQPGTTVGLTIGNVVAGTSFSVYQSGTLGQLGTFIKTVTGGDANNIAETTFTVSQQFISVIGGDSASVFLQAFNFQQCTGSGIVGDPQFVGLRGQNFQIHGVAGEIYNIVSSPELQYNSRFVFLDQGECPIINGRKQKGCWSHPGSYLGDLGLKTRAGDKILLQSGPAKQGFALISVNGKELQPGDSVLLADDMGAVSFNNTHTASVTVGSWEFVFENSDMFVNQKVHVADTKGLRAHGLLGQTHKDMTYPGTNKYTQGIIDDYVVRSADLFGDELVWNYFN